MKQKQQNSQQLIKKKSETLTSVWHTWKFLYGVDGFQELYRLVKKEIPQKPAEKEALNCIHLATGIQKQNKGKLKQKWKIKWMRREMTNCEEGKCKNCMRKCHSQRLLNATPPCPLLTAHSSVNWRWWHAQCKAGGVDVDAGPHRG